MVRVVFINHLRVGSASSYRQEGLSKYLRRLGCHTTLLGRRGDDKARRGGSSLRREAETPAFDQTEFWEEPITGRIMPNLSLAKECLEEADIVHVNRASPYTASMISLLRGFRRGALVVDMEDWDGYGGYSTYAGKAGPRGWLLTGFERTFPKQADAVVVVSSLLRSYMQSVGVVQDKLFFVPNGFDEDLFRPDVDGSAVREEYGLGTSPVVMYSGALWSFERELHEVALTAFRKVCDEIPDAKLLLSGRGNLELREIIGSLKLENNVVATGFVPRARMPELMAAADVALHVISYTPFHQASSPVVVPEYMAMGKAVVAPGSGELANMLSEGAGVPVNGLDPVALASAVVKLLRDDSLRREVGRKAMLRSRELYSYRVAASSLKRAYDAASISRSA